MKIAIDIGHCSTGDRGAVSACGLSEHDYWAKHAGIIGKALRARSHRVKIFRREDHNRLIARECDAINDWDADIVVSLHLNSADTPSAHGHEIIHHPGSHEGSTLAAAINTSLCALGYTADRGIKIPMENRGNAFLARCYAPAVIIEAGFLSNPGDVAALTHKAPDIAKAIAEGIHRYAVA